VRAKQVIYVSRQFAADVGLEVVPLPPVNWFVKGPRGGIYMATGERTRSVSDEEFPSVTGGPPIGTDRLLIVDVSDGAKYVRPGTPLHDEAREALR
jgi:hypothetical protein